MNLMKTIVIPGALLGFSVLAGAAGYGGAYLVDRQVRKRRERGAVTRMRTCPEPEKRSLAQVIAEYNTSVHHYNLSTLNLNAAIIQKVGGVPGLRELLGQIDPVAVDEIFNELMRENFLKEGDENCE